MKNRISWINDSKATTPESVLSALKVTVEEILGKEDSLYLLIGGLAKKGASWQGLWKLLEKYSSEGVKIKIITFGKDADLIRDSVESQNINFESNWKTLNEALIYIKESISNSNIQSKDIILLSPGCASFDEFRSFEERGEKFKKFI